MELLQSLQGMQRPLGGLPILSSLGLLYDQWIRSQAQHSGMGLSFGDPLQFKTPFAS